MTAGPPGDGGDRPAVCGSCGAPILWARHQGTLRPAPLDARPDPAGLLALVPAAGGPLYRALRQAERFGRTRLYTSHLATCPNAARYRRRRAP